MPQIKQNPDGSLGVQGADLDDGAFVVLELQYTTTSPLTSTVAVLARRMVVKSIILRPDVASSNAVTVTLRKVASGTAIASGTALHTGTGNLQGTANTNQVLAVTTADSIVDAGQAIGAVISGALGAAGSGTITVLLAPA